MGMCKKNSLLSICFVVRRVVAVGCAGIFFDIRFGHCTSCLFDNSSVKLCKAQHAVAVRAAGREL